VVNVLKARATTLGGALGTEVPVGISDVFARRFRGASRFGTAATTFGVFLRVGFHGRPAALLLCERFTKVVSGVGLGTARRFLARARHPLTCDPSPPKPGSLKPLKALTLRELPEEAVLLRIFIGTHDRWHHQPLYEAIVFKAREMHLGGATVLRGPMGFGKSSHMHSAKIFRLSMDLPIVIENVDSKEKVEAFLPVVDEMMDSGLVTMERAQVIRYRHKDRKEEKLRHHV
jgi:PII-like signaling protein